MRAETLSVSRGLRPLYEAFAVLVCLICLCVDSRRSFSRDLGAVTASGTIRIATEGATPPFNYFENGRLVGFDVDVGNAVAGKLAVRPAWVAVGFDTLLLGLNLDRYDLVAMGLGSTPGRAAAVELATYYCSGALIVSRPGGPRHRAELAGKTVGVQVGTSYLDAIGRIPGLNIKVFPRDTDALQNLLTERTDAWVSDQLTVLWIARHNPTFKFQLGDMLFEERDGMAIAKGNVSLRDAVNKAFAALRADGTLKTLAVRYFGRDVSCP